MSKILEMSFSFSLNVMLSMLKDVEDRSNEMLCHQRWEENIHTHFAHNFLHIQLNLNLQKVLRS